MVVLLEQEKTCRGKGHSPKTSHDNLNIEPGYPQEVFSPEEHESGFGKTGIQCS